MEMEKSTYWMWSRRKFSGSPLYNSLITPSVAASSTYHQSWEEQAFAEDSADHLGGCVWPPRSYTCSYCGREFRSAQALGGHMNVHRRDRARLKQSTPSSASDSHNRDDVNLNRLSTQIQYPHQVSTLLYNHNPNLGVTPSTLSPHPRVSSSLVEPKKTIITASQSITDLIPNRLELRLGRENWMLREVDCRGTINLSENQEESAINRKRRRVDEETIRSDVLKFKTINIQELDLELRLGDAPKVK